MPVVVREDGGVLDLRPGDADAVPERPGVAGVPGVPGVTGVEGVPARRVMALVFMTVFIDFLGLGILIPVIPFLVERFSEQAMAVGVLGAAFAMSQFLATPALGALSDRVGRRKVLMTSLFGSAAGYAVFGLAGSLWMMAVARMIDGVTGANVSTAQAALADITAPEKRRRAFALIGVAVGLGFVIGPALGGILSEKVSLTAPVFTACVLSLGAGLFALVALPETLPVTRRRRGAVQAGELNPLAHVGSAWRVPVVRWALLALVAVNIPFAGLSNNFGVYLDRVYAIDSGGAAMLFTWMGVVLMVVQGVVVRRLPERVSDQAAAMLGFALLGAGLVVIAFAPGAWALYVGIALVAAGNGLSTPTITGMISRGVGAGDQGAALGVTTGMLSLTRVAGPLLAAVAFDRVSPSSAYWSGAVWVVIGAGMLLAGWRAAPVRTDIGGRRAGVEDVAAGV